MGNKMLVLTKKMEDRATEILQQIEYDENNPWGFEGGQPNVMWISAQEAPGGTWNEKLWPIGARVKAVLEDEIHIYMWDPDVPEDQAELAQQIVSIGRLLARSKEAYERHMITHDMALPYTEEDYIMCQLETLVETVEEYAFKKNVTLRTGIRPSSHCLSK